MALTPEQLADIRTRIPARPHSDVPTPYEDLVRRIMLEGTLKSDRTGTGTISLFGQQMRFDLSEGFPLLTTKTVFFKGLAYELLWFLKGSSNVRWLQEHNVHIWDDWADENGDLGPVYGVQWRSWPAPTPEDPNRTIDQIGNVLDLIRNHPDSRRMVVSAWNPAEVENMALPPCHALFQFYVADGRLSCQLYQRSCDMFIGVPFNIASYSLLTMMIAQQTGLEPGEFVWTGGDCHVYDNHVDQVLEQLSREPYPYPKIEIRKADSLFDYQYEDFTSHWSLPARQRHTFFIFFKHYRLKAHEKVYFFVSVRLRSRQFRANARRSQRKRTVLQDCPFQLRPARLLPLAGFLWGFHTDDAIGEPWRQV